MEEDREMSEAESGIPIALHGAQKWHELEHDEGLRNIPVADILRFWTFCNGFFATFAAFAAVGRVLVAFCARFIDAEGGGGMESSSGNEWRGNWRVKCDVHIMAGGTGFVNRRND